MIVFENKNIMSFIKIPSYLKSKGLRYFYIIFMEEEERKWTWLAAYEYEGDHTADILSDAVVENFLFPCWAKEFDAGDHEQGGELKILDSHSFRVEEKGNIVFCDKNIKDLEELVNSMMGFHPQEIKFQEEKISQAKKKKIKKDIRLAQEYGQTAKKLLQIWKVFPTLQFDENLHKDLKEVKQFNVFILEKTPQIKQIEKIEKQEKKPDNTYYFLIRFPEKSKQSKMKIDSIQNDYILPLILKREGDQKIYHYENILKLQFTLQFSPKSLTKQRKQRYFRNPENLNVRVLQIKIFMDEPTQKNLKSLINENITKQDQSYYPIEPVINRNRIFYPYQEPTFQKTKIYLRDHFHLAFQGGGAKGLAYVGTYRAIKEYQDNHGNVPITSIIGSSAGGIIALAISTGIPAYELEKVCYKMREIPSNDRIDSSDYKSYDDYGNELNADALVDKLKQVCEQLGILKKENLENLINQISKTDYWKKIKKELLNLLIIAAPAIGDMLSNDTHNFNWQGLLVHGALMKGDAIHDIAADCLIKYFVRVRAEKGESNFEKFLEECLGPQIQYKIVENEEFVTDVKYTNDMFKAYRLKSLDLLKINLHGMMDKINNQDKISLFLLGLYNRFKLLFTKMQIQQFLKENIFKEVKKKTLQKYPQQQKEFFSDENCTDLEKVIEKGQQLYSCIKNLLEKKQSQILKEAIKRAQQKYSSQKLFFKEVFKTLDDVRIKVINSRQYQEIGAVISSNYQEEELNYFQEGIRRISQKFPEFKQLLSIQQLKTFEKMMEKIDKYQNECSQILSFIIESKNNTLGDIVRMAQQKYPQQKQHILLKGTFEEVLQNIEQTSAPQLLLSDKNSPPIKQAFEKIKQAFEKKESITIQDCLKTWFSQNFKDLNQKINQQNTKILQLFNYFEGTQSICQLIELTFDKTQRKQIFQNAKYTNYKEAVRKLRLTVQRITMKQYYLMNKIEVSCTSVDLDNKVLRFFNHKTTPDLPVCRAVQMTGSFPVGFKAQKWQEGWGKYHVYLQDRKLEIDLTGHQFTDGGLLANFPIKYMDNQFVRQRYFTHKDIMGVTVLLGFGLDHLEPQRYSRTTEQDISDRQKRCKISAILQKIKYIGQSNKLNGGLKLYFNTKDDKKSYEWVDFQHRLIQEVPLLRFILKISDAYPNADRNLSLQAFDKTVFKQELQNQWMNKESFKKNMENSDKVAFKSFFYEYRHHIKPQIVQNQAVPENGPNLSAFSDRIAENEKKMQFLRQNLCKWPECFEQKQQITVESLKMSLIKIFYTSLQMPQNSSLADKYTKMYAMMKYLSDKNLFQKDYKQINIETNNQDINISPYMNRMCFKALFDKKDFQEISKHLGFFEYHTELYENFAKQNLQFDIYLRQNYDEGRGFKKLQSYSKQNFANMKLFDITEDIRRVVQLIYLMIEGRSQKPVTISHFFSPDEKITQYRLLHQERLISLTKKVKTMDYKKLLSELPLEKILTFLKRELTLHQDKFHASPWFKDLIKTYNDRSSIWKKTFLSQFIKVTLEENYSSNKKLSYPAWFEGDYRFVRNCLAKQDIKQIMKAKIYQDVQNQLNQRRQLKRKIDDMRQRGTLAKAWDSFTGFFKSKKNVFSQISQLLFNFLYNESPTLEKIEEVMELDSFVKFIISKETQWNAEFKISDQLKQSVNRFKSIMINILFERINNQVDSNILNFKQENKKKIDQFIEEKNQNRQLEKLQYLLTQYYKQQDNLNGIKVIDKQKSQLYFNLRCLSNLIKSQQLTKERLNLNNEQQDINGDLSNKQSRILQIYLFMIQQDSISILISSKLELMKKKQKDPNISFYSVVPSAELSERLINEQKEKENYVNTLINLHKEYSDHISYLFLILKEIIIIGSEIKVNQEIKKAVQKIKQIYYKIHSQFLEKYRNLSELPNNMINEASVGKTFLIKFEFIEALIISCQKILNQSKINQQNQEKQFIKHAQLLVKRFKMKKFNLPLLDIDSTTIASSLYQFKEKKILRVLKGRKIQQQNGKKKQNIHLIFEGIGNANEYLGGLYLSLTKIVQNKGNVQRQIKMITCSNFHSIFGFLLALTHTPEEIREEMYEAQFLVNDIQSPYETAKSADLFVQAKNIPQHQQQYIHYLENEHLSMFDRLQEMNTHNYQKESLNEEFRKMRQLYENEKINLMKKYELILEETAKQLCTIRKNNHSSMYPVEIAKKFGFKYICELNEEHNYHEIYKNSFENFKKVTTVLYSTFGHLLNGIISSKIVQNYSIDINQDNAEERVKAVLINRLLTVYKLKNYIISKLKKARLNQNISLSQFYQAPATRKLFLNFTVIDINRQRLTFLNKNTSPHMPIWAAIVASSSLPFLHNMFEANKEWEAPNIVDFNEAYLYDFFKAEPDNDSRITRFLSGNFISSIPLELLSNNTVQYKILYDSQSVKKKKKKKELLQKEMLKKEQKQKLIKELQQEQEQLVDYAICFERKDYGSRTVDLKVTKNYLNLSTSFVLKSGASFGLNQILGLASSVKKKIVTDSIHENNTYKFKESIFNDVCAYLMPWLGSTTFNSTFSTLSNSNDNFCLKWYYNKLIRLPIKVDTLEFNKIVDEDKLKKYKVNILSEQAEEAVERAYEISKYFMEDIHQRKRVTQKQVSLQSRIKIKFRMNLTKMSDKTTGIELKLLKLSFLNHSKWNCNKYNNFVLECQAEHSKNNFQSTKFERITESQLLFMIELNSKLVFRISFPENKKSIRELYFSMSQLFSTEIQRDNVSYDYEFSAEDIALIHEKNLKPLKKNDQIVEGPIIKITNEEKYFKK